MTAAATVIPTVTTSATVSDISSSGGTLGGSVSSDGNGSITERGIYYSTSTGFANGAGTKVSATGSSLGTGAFTQIVTGLSPNTTYYFKAFAANSAGSGYGTEQSFTTANVTQTPPTISAAPSATVDGNIELTFSDNTSYRAAITEIKVGGTALPIGAYSTLTAGKIVLIPSASSLLQSAGTKIITITATNFEPVNLSQAISHGVANKLGILTAPVAPAANGAVFATQPVVAVQDQYGNTVLTSTETVTAAVGSGAWILGGTAGVAAVNGVANFSGLTAGKVGTLTGGTISFTSGSLTGVASGGFNLPLPVLTITTSASYNEGVTGQTGSVTIPFAAPTDISVTLASSSAVDLKVDGDGNGYVASTTVLIASGTSSSQFFLETPADNTIDADSSVTLTASATDFSNGTRAITVRNVDFAPPSIVINKVYNSGVANGADDVVELLVVGNGTPGSTVNLQGMVLKDYSSSAASDGGGAYIFANNLLWSAVKAGTLIVLTKPGTTPPAEDLDGADFVIKINLSNTAYFTAGTGSLDIGGTELVQIKASGSVQAGFTGVIHSFAVGTSTAAQVAAAPQPKLICAASGNNPFAMNSTKTLTDFNGTNATQSTSSLTFGVANNADNSTYISSLRGSKDISISVDSAVAIINENAGLQAGKITVALSQPATEDVTVNLSASPSGAVTIPSTAVILNGASSASIDVTPIDDSAIAGNRVVTITGSATGWSSGNNTMTIVDMQFNNPTVVINEVFNGGTSGSDAVELLVIQNNSNMVGMILKDFSTNMTGDAGRQFTFADNALWQSVKAGTLIVLTGDATATEDTDATDGVVTVKLANTTYFAATGGTFDISNIDMVMLKAAGSGGTGITGAIHTFGNGAAGSLFNLANGAKLLFAAGGAGGGANNATSAIGDYNGMGVTGGTATLGAANNANNQTYITALRASVNSAPTDISLTATSIAENNAVDATVGTLSTTDANSSDTHTYSLVAGTGGADNGSFNIIGTSLRASAAFDFETKSSYLIRVRTTDSGGATFEKQFTITVTDVVEQTPQETYLASFGLSGANLLGTADPDGDGMNNNAEFAFGTSPVSGDSRAATLSTGTGTIKLTYLQRDSGVTYTVKSLPDLATAFDSGTTVPPSVAADQTSKPSGYTRYEASVNTGSTRGFLRVRAVAP